MGRALVPETQAGCAGARTQELKLLPATFVCRVNGVFHAFIAVHVDSMREPNANRWIRRVPAARAHDPK